MSHIIMEACLSSFSIIPISLVYSFSGMNDRFTNGVESAKYPSVQALDNIAQCAAQSSVPNSHLSYHNLKQHFLL